MADPTNVFAMDDIKFMTGYNVEPVVASETALEEAIDQLLRLDALARAAARHRAGGRRLRLARRAAAASRRSMDGPALTIDDMAAIGGLSEIDLDSMGDAEADVETVKTGRGRDRPRRRSRKSADAAPGHQAHQRPARRLAQAGRLRHPHRALREGVPRPVPHRRHPLQRDGAADEAARTRSPPASRSWPSSTSRRSACPRTAASRSR